jgi:hypothetical protein
MVGVWVRVIVGFGIVGFGVFVFVALVVGVEVGLGRSVATGAQAVNGNERKSRHEKCPDLVD